MREQINLIWMASLELTSILYDMTSDAGIGNLIQTLQNTLDRYSFF